MEQGMHQMHEIPCVGSSCTALNGVVPCLPDFAGHGGNTGSQSNATIIRALALGHLRPSDWWEVIRKVGGMAGAELCRYHDVVWTISQMTYVPPPTPPPTPPTHTHTPHHTTPSSILQECLAGAIMGAGLGVVIYAFSLVWSGITSQVGLTVAVALPVRWLAAMPTLIVGYRLTLGAATLPPKPPPHLPPTHTLKPSLPTVGRKFVGEFPWRRRPPPVRPHRF